MKKPKTHFKRTRLRDTKSSAETNGPKKYKIKLERHYNPTVYLAGEAPVEYVTEGPVATFTRGFLGSFKLAASAVKAVGGVGGRFIKEEDDETGSQRRTSAP